MLTFQDRIIEKVIKHFDGLPKIEILDMLQKIEMLLLNQDTTFHFKKCKEELEKQNLSTNVIPLNNKGYCSLEDSCQFIKVYKFVLTTSIFNTEYLRFTIQNGYKTYEFDNKNIEKIFANTFLQNEVGEFLKKNNVKDRNKKTKRLKILEYLDQFEPNLFFSL